MAYTQADLEALRKAIATGALRVRQGDRDVTYRSLAEMQQVEQMMLRSLGQAKATRLYPTYGSGL
jgi:hypothetical protein